MNMVIIICKIIVSYILGSISGSMLVGKLKGIDIRKMGSGNAGGTNTFRIMGAFYAFIVLLIDGIKGYIAVTLIALLKISNDNSIHFINHEYLQILCGLSVVLGHVYPIFYEFRGGKGAATMIGVLAALFPLGLLICFIAWLSTLIISGYVGLSTIIAGITFPIITLILYNNEIASLFIFFSFIISSFIIFTHRDNIKRMKNGTEKKFQKIMLFSKKKASVKNRGFN